MRTASPSALPPWLRQDVGAKVAVAFVALAGVVASLAAEGGFGGMLAAGLAVVVVAIAAVDARRFIIPDELTLCGLALGLAYAGLVGAPDAAEAIVIAALRGAALALAFLALRWGYRRLRGRDGLGLGDVKLAAVAGVWLDWPTIPIAIEIAAVTALAAYGIRQMRTGRAIRAGGRLPFGLFLAPAIWVGWMLDRWLVTQWG